MDSRLIIKDFLRVSSGFSEQSGALGTILSGIEDVANNTLENTYVLSYIFNNFSYNTLIQDMIIDGENVANNSDGVSLAKAKELMNADTISKYKDKSNTLSNYPKNSKNNYFYGAEIEYILYGNKTAATNVTYTKASIYAIRFAFNCIYAFTNSTIRNSTMAAGLAVQAATMGIVPYQVVQIVLQLALAAAESAIDLDMMNNGLKVAVVKSNDTWMLSVKSAVKTAGGLAAAAAANVADKAIDKISSGLQGIVDATASELDQSINDLSSNLQSATRAKLEEITDSAFSCIQSSIEEKLNELQFIDYKTHNATTEVNRVFQELENELANEITLKFAGNPVADAILPTITAEVSSILSTTKENVLNVVQNANTASVGDAIVAEMTNIKTQLISTLSDSIDFVLEDIQSVVSSLTQDVSGQLNSYIQNNADQLSETATKEIKDSVTNITNDFVSEYLDSGAETIGGGADAVTGKTSSSVASMIKFGYKDYLMLFTFISISVNDDAVLSRTADVIQLNIQNATTEKGASYQHKLTGAEGGKSFKMSEAKTYVSINASVKLDMLFMNMDFFTNILTDDDTETSGELTPAATIDYNGLYGY